ncbi:MAG: DUF479 domain-containing protein [Bacteroidetes bacterium]|nr:DUF479 domain-containing protein [Bacteroidota bacterium]
MNYLAHFFLAGKSEDLLIGNYIADSVKGIAYTNYPAGISKGILMHRALDNLIDTHEIAAQTKELLKPHLKRYSGIALDFLYDYLLAKNWEKFSDEPLQHFSDSTIEILSMYSNLPVEQQQFLRYMKAYNLPAAYAKEDIIRQALYHFTKRINAPYELNMAIDIYNLNKTDIDSHFDLFMKEAVIFSLDFSNS